MKSPFLKLAVALLVLTALAAVAYYVSAPDSARTRKEAERFYDVASKGTHLLDAIREAPQFQVIYFGTCAQIERAGTAGEANPFVFIPKVGERVKFKSVADALARNPAMLRDFEACRKASVVFMITFPYRGEVGIDLDEKGNIVKVRPPVFGS